jgi:hypothetical protein
MEMLLYSNPLPLLPEIWERNESFPLAGLAL